MKITKYKKNGFSLTEIALALLIVAVLAAVTIPIVGNQIAKTDEYAYYMAYRTVEKMAAQIVAHGDPQEDVNFETSYLPEQTKIAKTNNNPADGFIYYLQHKSHIANIFNKAVTKMAYAEKYIFSKLFPNTIAVSDEGRISYTDEVRWDNIDFDNAWLRVAVCYDFDSTGNSSPRKDVPCTKGTERAAATVFAPVRIDGDGDEKEPITPGSWRPTAGELGLLNKKTIYSQADADWVNSYISDTADGEGKYTIYYRPVTGNNARDELYPECLLDCTQYNSSSNFTYRPVTNSFDASGEIIVRPVDLNLENLDLSGKLILSTAKIFDNDNFSQIFSNNTCKSNPNSSSVYNAINAWSSSTSTIPNAQSFCTNYFTTTCAGTMGSISTGDAEEKTYSVQWIPGTNDNDDSDDLTPRSTNAGECKITVTTTRPVGGATSGGVLRIASETFDSAWCTNHGYINFINKGAPNYIDCQCKNGFVPTVNNDKACGPKSLVTGVNKGRKLYHDPVLRYVGDRRSYTTNPTQLVNDKMAKDSDGNAFKSCKNGFSEPSMPLTLGRNMSPNLKDGYCCPENGHSVSGVCHCNPRYTAVYNNGFLTSCTLESCPEGYHKVQVDNGQLKCLKNPSIVKSDRFCELITEHWNIKNSTCNNFERTGQNQATYYAAAQTAAKGNDNVLMSADAKAGAFQELTPNIVLANGLKMWIATDKAASIPMLSYYTEGMSDKQNACVHILKNKNDNHTRTACENAGGYYCGGEELSCMKIDGSTNLADARNCCSSPNFTGLNENDPRRYAISGYTVYVDINGDKGDGTLWQDVFPFFISSNGTVYPAYPINASEDSGLKYIGGNNQKQLSVDVYYFDKDEVKGKQKRVVYSDVPYARGMCLAGKVNAATPYCQNLGDKFHAPAENACDSHNCVVAIRKRLRFL